MSYCTVGFKSQKVAHRLANCIHNKFELRTSVRKGASSEYHILVIQQAKSSGCRRILKMCGMKGNQLPVQHEG